MVDALIGLHCVILTIDVFMMHIGFIILQVSTGCAFVLVTNWAPSQVFCEIGKVLQSIQVLQLGHNYIMLKYCDIRTDLCVWKHLRASYLLVMASWVPFFCGLQLTYLNNPQSDFQILRPSWPGFERRTKG